MTSVTYAESRKVALYWHLRELVEGSHENDPAGTSGHERSIAVEALKEDNVLAALERIRHEAWRRPIERRHAADLITEYCWPDDAGFQRPTWETHYVKNTYELNARRRLNKYKPPVSPSDVDGRTGYHHGGVWFPHIGSAEPLSCPECGHQGEFWDFDAVDSGDTYEPEHVCHCGWEPNKAVAHK